MIKVQDIIYVAHRVPDLERILQEAEIPVKVSAVVNEHNLPELDEFLERCHRIGVSRLVLRQLYGTSWPWPSIPEAVPAGEYRGNPVLDYAGMEVTLWNFDRSTCRSLNLFADGTPEFSRPSEMATRGRTSEVQLLV